MQKRFKTASPAAVDLLSKMLTFDPSKRITAAEALSHEYFAAWRKEADVLQSVCPTPLSVDIESESEDASRLPGSILAEAKLYEDPYDARRMPGSEAGH